MAAAEPGKGSTADHALSRTALYLVIGALAALLLLVVAVGSTVSCDEMWPY